MGGGSLWLEFLGGGWKTETFDLDGNFCSTDVLRRGCELEGCANLQNFVAAKSSFKNWFRESFLSLKMSSGRRCSEHFHQTVVAY